MIGRTLTCFLLLRCALMPCARAGEEVSSAAPADSGGIPWTITGQSLEGLRAGITTLVRPRAEQGSTTVTAEQGIWYRADGLLNLIGDVVLRDSSRTITAERASYDRGRGLAILTDRVRGAGPEGRLAAHELWYWRDDGRLELRDSVRLEETEWILTARRLLSDTRAQTAVATDSVVILDPRDSTRVGGQRCDLDRVDDHAVVTGSPWLHRPGRDGEVGLDIHGDTLEMRAGGSIGEARGRVHIHRGEVEATCGRALFDFDKDLLKLERDPVAVDPDGDVRGDSMAVILRAGRAERLEVIGHARLRYNPASKPGERNFVQGDTLIALMDSSGVREIEVRSHASSLYIPSPPDRRENVGENLSRALRILVWLENGEARRVDLREQASGEYVLPLERPDSASAAMGDTLYVGRALEHFRSSPQEPLPDSLQRAGPFDPTERVSYQGKAVSFLVPERRIEIRDQGKVHYHDLELDSDEIVYEAARDRVTALGKPTLKDAANTLVGKRMIYRMDRQQGFVYQGKTEFEGGYYRGDEIKRVNDKILLVRGGDYTTCDADSSHYHFHSRKMKILTGERVVARPIVLYLKNIPLMALPYWVFPIRRGRHSGILMPDVEFGFDRSRGRFVRNLGYYLAPNDYSDAMLWGDYYDQRPRWILNGQFRYRLRYRLSGNLYSSYSREQISGGKRARWDLRGDHDQELGERFTLRFRADFVSDKDYRDDREFGGTVDERLNRILRSNIDLRKSWSSSSLSMTVDRTENLDRTSSGYRVQESVPSIDFSVNSFQIGHKADERGRGGRLPFLSTVYSRLSTSFRSTYLRPWNAPSSDNQAARIATGLSSNGSFGPYLKVSPSVSATGAYFRRDRRGRSHQIGGVWDSGLSAQTTLYGTVPLRLGPLVGLRHVIEPSVSYRYAPDFPSLRERDQGRTVSRFASVGGIDLSGAKASSMRMSLTQRFHLKLQGSDPRKPRKIDNLILWTTSSGYDFLRHKKPLSTISNSLRLQPASFFENSWSVSHDPYRRVATSLSVQTAVRISGGAGGSKADTTGQAPLEDYGGFGQAGTGRSRPGERQLGATGPWSISCSHSYSRGETRATESSTLNLSVSLTPTRLWRLGYSVYYDLRRRDVRSQALSLYRDLHCWEIQFDQRASGGNSEYSFRISVKALPDVKYERQRR